ncbi:hypothetical protein E2C01_012195 [Portunus trituberculatus]|uniref:Uncharacterized protein n=1 Tax=Portunus trituberculatus TaxID=210409 RepID=A0A5B7DDD2_PORTR|nr:hypothetical protein [Portunus trituberculatus]
MQVAPASNVSYASTVRAPPKICTVAIQNDPLPAPSATTVSPSTTASSSAKTISTSTKTSTPISPSAPYLSAISRTPSKDEKADKSNKLNLTKFERHRRSNPVHGPSVGWASSLGATDPLDFPISVLAQPQCFQSQEAVVSEITFKVPTWQQEQTTHLYAPGVASLRNLPGQYLCCGGGQFNIENIVIVYCCGRGCCGGGCGGVVELLRKARRIVGVTSLYRFLR